MMTVRWFCAVAVAAVLVVPVRGQQPAQPGPEHEVLKKLEGTWDTTMKFMGQEFKGTVEYKMDLGGLWLLSKVESDLGGQKFHARGADTYDAGKKKYIGVWIDSMTTAPMVMEGTYDKDKKTLTLVGEGPGPDGKPVKHTGVSEMKDEDTILFKMFAGDAKEPMFTIDYKRKK
jgi:hypothetical protein